jgi:hypothetical protein
MGKKMKITKKVTVKKIGRAIAFPAHSTPFECKVYLCTVQYGDFTTSLRVLEGTDGVKGILKHLMEKEMSEILIGRLNYYNDKDPVDDVFKNGYLSFVTKND